MRALPHKHRLCCGIPSGPFSLHALLYLVLFVMMSVRCGDSNLFIVWLTIYWYGSKSIDLSVRLHHLAAN